MQDENIIFFEIFPWTENFETGIALIDEQHKKLVDILNQLAAHLANRSDEIKLTDIFNELAEYADYHFQSEEKIWAEHFQDDEWFINHEHTHESFIHKVIALKNNDNNQSMDHILYEIVNFLSKWLAYHILDTDKRMAIVVKNLQAGFSLAEAKANATDDMSGSTKVIIETVLTMYESLSTRTLDLMREKSLRLQAEESLRRSEERWKFILETGSENVWDWDIAEDAITQSDETTFSLEAFKNHLVRNRDDVTTIHPLDVQKVNSKFQALVEGKTDFYIHKHRIVHQNGAWSWVLTRGKIVNRCSDGVPLRIIGTHTDITERELASFIHQNTTQAMFVSDSNNKIVSINPAFTKITGYTADEAIGQNPRFLASGRHPSEFYQKLWESLAQTGSWSGRINNRRKDGQSFTELLNINLINDDNGNLDYYVAMFNDITQEERYKQEQKEQEEYLIQHSRMAQMGELISMIAHQWNQPLSVILSTSSMLQVKLLMKEYDLTQQEGIEACKTFFNDNLVLIDERVKNLSATMKDFRNFYNPNKTLSTIPLNSPAVKALYIIRALLVSENIEIEEHYDCHAQVAIHENEMIQVVLNILQNAQDNFKEKNTPNPKITITCKSRDNDVILEICDNGGGIPTDIISRIFEPYFSVKHNTHGSGLGLHMSKLIVESHHNGIIDVHNNENGACFSIKLPQIR